MVMIARAWLLYKRFFWNIFLGINIALLMFILLHHLFISKPNRIEEAVLNGKRIVISLATKTLKGSLSLPAPNSPLDELSIVNEKSNYIEAATLPALGSELFFAGNNELPPLSPFLLFVINKPLLLEENFQLIPNNTNNVGGDNIKSNNDYKNDINQKYESDNSLYEAKMFVKQKPSITVIVEDLGLNSVATDMAFSLPNTVTLGFSPYTTNLDSWYMKSKITGHNILLQLPLEAGTYNDNQGNEPGPYTLLNSANRNINMKRLGGVLSRIPEVKALYLSQKEAALVSNDIQVIEPIIEILREEEISLIASNQINPSLLAVAEQLSLPITLTNMAIDNYVTESAIKASLDQAGMMAKELGHITIVGHAYPITIKVLKEWIDSLKDIDIISYDINNQPSYEPLPDNDISFDTTLHQKYTSHDLFSSNS